EPRRNLPRAMVASLVLALLIYLPLLFLISTVGVPDGTDIAAMASADPEAVVAVAAEAYLGRTGFWLVILAAVLAMASALQANLLASSHIALVMARDRNLPARLRQLDEARGTPVAAVLLTSATVVVAVLAIPDVAAAGAASSLIFLISFALAHWTNILARRRGGGRSESLRLPLFPLVPAVGGLACLALALFQGLSVPAAGGIALAWLAAGGGLYYAIFSRRAQVADAAAEALDPTLVRLRGRSPLVLVPIANPASAESMVMVANALAPAQVGRVLLLSVVRTPETWRPDQVPPQLAYAQQVLGESLTTAFAAELAPEALVTVAKDPWRDIRRVAQTYRCESLLLGLGDLQTDDAGNDNGDEDGLDPEALGANLEWLMREVASDVVLLRAPDGWRPSTVRRVLVPVGGRRDQSSLRARLLGSLLRTQDLEVRYLGISLPGADADHEAWLEREIQLLADDEASGRHEVTVVRRDSVVDAVVEHAADVDLVVLGLSRQRHRRVFGRIPAGVIRGSQTAVLMIRQRA
ncbi:MAG: amino acid permease, partial [Acidobacteriota bacterium]